MNRKALPMLGKSPQGVFWGCIVLCWMGIGTAWGQQQTVTSGAFLPMNAPVHSGQASAAGLGAAGTAFGTAAGPLATQAGTISTEISAALNGNTIANLGSVQYGGLIEECMNRQRKAADAIQANLGKLGNGTGPVDLSAFNAVVHNVDAIRQCMFQMLRALSNIPDNGTPEQAAAKAEVLKILGDEANLLQNLVPTMNRLGNAIDRAR